MSKGLEALQELLKIVFIYGGEEQYKIIKKELEVLDILKEICLQGKNEYGEGTWGWVEFDLDKEPKLKEWLKDE